jgi:protein pelota
MDILKHNFKKGFIEIKTESLDDLWIVSNIIDPGDLVSSKTSRKIKIGKEDERSTKASKKLIYLTIQVKEIKFHKYSNSLRISGTTIEEKEDIPKGAHHTLDIIENSILKIQKEKWFDFQIKRIKEAVEEKKSKILICILERDEACFALIKGYGYDYLGEIQGKVQKKSITEKIKNRFYDEVIKKLEDYDKRLKIDYIILASPAFWKEDLMKEIKSDIKEKITLATCNSFGKTGINEVLKRDEIKKVLKKDRIVKETNLVEELLIGISKNSPVSYGLKEVKEAIEAKAVTKLLVTDELIHKLRQENKYEELEQIMKKVENSKGEVHIISTNHEAGKKLKGLGGIGAILRYKIN